MIFWFCWCQKTILGLDGFFEILGDIFYLGCFEFEMGFDKSMGFFPYMTKNDISKKRETDLF